MPPPPAAPAVEEPAPSWLAASEVDRLRNEKALREKAAAEAALNPPVAVAKELDWRYAGQMIERHSAERQYAEWQVGALSVLIFIGLWLVCVPAALFFIWRTGWKSSSKLLVGGLAFLLPVVLAIVRLELALQRLQ
jgi:4-amino-4-deoxy-L-arabinose transferase-like glycosyltransferase